MQHANIYKTTERKKTSHSPSHLNNKDINHSQEIIQHKFYHWLRFYIK